MEGLNGRQRWAAITRDRFLPTTLCVLTVLFLVLGSGGPATVLKYSNHCAHKLTSDALLKGHLEYPRPLAAGLELDMQIHNGAQFTNWGYGIALLQAPFHFIYRLFTHRSDTYFPDRLIYFFYASLSSVLLLLALGKVFEKQLTYSRDGALLLGAIFTWVCLSYSLFGLTSYRFAVYEETVAYSVILQLAALAAYLWYRVEPNERWIYLGGLSASLALLTRGSALFAYLGWAGAFYLVRKNRRVLFPIAVAFLPLLFFWLYSNWVKSGVLVSMGTHNTISGNLRLGPQVRFGPDCTTSLRGALEVFRVIFSALFLGEPRFPKLHATCHFDIERGWAFPLPYIDKAFLPLLAILFTLHLRDTRRKWEVYLPYACLLLLLIAYTLGSTSFNYRYAGDFWPLIFLIFAHWLFQYGAARKTRLVAIALFLPLFCFWKIVRDVLPNFPTLALADSFPVSCWNENEATRRELNRVPLDARLQCARQASPSRPPWMGWASDCSVKEMSSFFLGIAPNQPDRHYRLSLLVDRSLPSAPPVYINGRYYTGHWQGKDYEVDFDLNSFRLSSPGVLVSIRWARAGLSPELRLWEARIL